MCIRDRPFPLRPILMLGNAVFAAMQKVDLIEIFPVAQLHDFGFEAVSYTHLDVYKRQGRGIQRTAAQEGCKLVRCHVHTAHQLNDLKIFLFGLCSFQFLSLIHIRCV